MSSKTVHICGHCGQAELHSDARHVHYTVCDGCGYEQMMPSSWTEETNPLRGWVSIQLDGGFFQAKEFCSTCVSLGVVLAQIERTRHSYDEKSGNPG